MAGSRNGVHFALGFKVQDTESNNYTFMQKSATDAGIYNNAGVPENVINANMGSICMDRTNGNLYFKRSGTGTTGWLKIANESTTAVSFVTPSGTANPSNGILSLAQPAAGITITGAGNTVTFALADDLAALEALSSTGILSRTGSSTYSERTITGTSGKITVTNGNGVSGNPTLTIPDAFLSSNADTFNLGMTLSGSTITMHGYDGTELSASNPAFLRMQNKGTAGQSVIYTLTSNIDVVNTDMSGNLLGTTTARAWANAMPLFVYFIIDDSNSTPIPAFSRLPHLQTSPTVANLGCPGTATADTEYSMFIWDTVTLGDYDQNPVLLVGSVRGTKDASDVWTFSMTSGSNGIDLYDKQLTFGFPQGHNGADASSYFVAGAGTVPAFSNKEYGYTIDLDGTCTTRTIFNGDGGTDGSGSVAVKISLPFSANQNGLSISSDSITLGNSRVLSPGGPPAGSSIMGFPMVVNSAPSNYFLYTNSDFMEYGDFTNGSRTITTNATYKVGWS